jgi:hypothetical protein
MTKQAERPSLIKLQSAAFDDEDLCTLQLNATDVVEWEVGESIPELGASIFQVAFKGYPIAEEGTLTHLGSVLYDACDYGLEIHQIIGDALYEARHPWLDYADAIKKKAFDFKSSDISRLDEQFLYVNEDGRLVVTDLCSMKRMSTKAKIERFKPLSSLEWLNFQTVEVYTDIN